MAEVSAGSAREHGREVAAVSPEHRMADGVDTEVHAVQTARRDASSDRGRLEPELLKLPARDDTVLARRELRDAGLDE
jgi:hypothetical protein